MKTRLIVPLITLLCSATAYAGQTGFYYKSEPGDPIGNGREAFYTDTQQKISIGPVVGTSVWPNTVIAAIYHSSNTDPQSFLLSSPGTRVHFSAPSGTELIEGDYANAVPFFSSWNNTQPVLWISSQQNVCCGVSGSFSVKEAVYDHANYELTRFAVDFVQRCPGSTGASYGYIRYNSDIPFPEGVPPSIASDKPLNKVGCFEADGPGGNDISLHVVNGASSYSYEWSAVVIEPAPVPPQEPCSGLLCPGTYLLSAVPQVVTKRTVTGIGETFAFELGLKETAKVLLKTTDALNGTVREAVMKGCVTDTTPPEITILSPKDGARYAGNNLLLDVKVTDLVDPNPQYTVQVDGDFITLDPDKPTHVKLSKPGAHYETTSIPVKVWAKDAYRNTVTEIIKVSVQHDKRR
jgi:hypothetical protein